METITTIISVCIIVHAFNGNVVSVEEYGAVSQQNDGEFSEETILMFQRLEKILRPISNRLLASGKYILVNGRLVENKQVNEIV
ncbi:MAG: hypothetical protein NT098_05340 [Candidatus Parcubacteria bacterium]|nr:hypothetical protein [Candidatus Parcubacteria bacterium]